ncbi:MAG: hypothetical protein F2681_07320 [Actinobacteria bacterium]|uniref:Unannotated protein n=1 Tax=freshwater metagenome TaxID=449393 RepID=A0A6J7NZ80_9ZZZZ|nr:hypothetical protein [Actinomycetota bacterium]MSW77030.1 hypothetical protein [Actinomycetota bacterium]MSX54182.1 hypothetical protein [Actinomycetota bacterium]MSX92274.1 hypothetical protein [Actinomycetota bacterium]MSZ82936.1 hypothetical protein [Actinomycetota bacterium]
MPIWRNPLDEWFRTHHGVISSPHLQLLGCSARTVYRMVEREELYTLLPGVFLSAQWPLGPEQKMVAACARNPFAMIGFTTAGGLWGYRKVGTKGLHLLVPHGCSPELDGIVVHRCRRIDPVDIVERADGIRLTSPPRTLFDSADMLGLSVARSVMEQILHERMCSLPTLVDTYRRLAHPNRPGTRTMAAVLASRPMWGAALQSHLEQLVLEAIERQGLPTPVTQCAIQLPSGRTIHADFGWPEWKVALEVDDPTWHDGADNRRNDAWRDRKATATGWAVARVARLDVEGPLDEAIRDVADILQHRQHQAA